MELEEILDDFFAGAVKVVILGAGSELMTDDKAGLLVVDRLSEIFKNRPNIKLINGSNAPENFTGEIKDFAPQCLIVVDAADMKEKAGSIMVIDPDVIEGVTFSTHMLPLKVMLGYLKDEIKCRVLILGIQPVNVDFGNEISKEVIEAIDEVNVILKKKLEKFE